MNDYPQEAWAINAGFETKYIKPQKVTIERETPKYHAVRGLYGLSNFEKLIHKDSTWVFFPNEESAWQWVQNKALNEVTTAEWRLKQAQANFVTITEKLIKIEK